MRLRNPILKMECSQQHSIWMPFEMYADTQYNAHNVCRLDICYSFGVWSNNVYRTSHVIYPTSLFVIHCIVCYSSSSFFLFFFFFFFSLRSYLFYELFCILIFHQQFFFIIIMLCRKTLTISSLLSLISFPHLPFLFHKILYYYIFCCKVQ